MLKVLETNPIDRPDIHLPPTQQINHEIVPCVGWPCRLPLSLVYLTFSHEKSTQQCILDDKLCNKMHGDDLLDGISYEIGHVWKKVPQKMIDCSRRTGSSTIRRIRASYCRRSGGHTRLLTTSIHDLPRLEINTLAHRVNCFCQTLYPTPPNPHLLTL